MLQRRRINDIRITLRFYVRSFKFYEVCQSNSGHMQFLLKNAHRNQLDKIGGVVRRYFHDFLPLKKV